MKIMSYTVGVKGSPAFSPSRTPLLTKTSSSSPKTSPSSVSPSSSFRLRFLQKQASSLSRKDASIVAVDPSHSPPPPPPPSMSLKRKRPTRINIPDLNSLSLTLPIASEGVKEVEIEGKQFSVFCKKGIREAMEDRHAAVVDLHGDPKQEIWTIKAMGPTMEIILLEKTADFVLVPTIFIALVSYTCGMPTGKMAFFGVFDGHGGVKAAEFAAENMGKKIMDEVMTSGGDGMKAAIRSAYLATDSEFLKEGTRGGACCLTALIKNSDLIVSNAGDCRAVLSRGGVAESLTDDHRPSREDERDRIENLGGYVDCCRGVWRLQGSLAVSRGIGDSHLKQWVTAEPETKILRIKPDCEFLILASDGLWDKVSNQEAVDIARSGCLKTDEVSMLSACKNLVDLSVLRGSIDDVSVVIIQLGHFI